MRHVVIGGGIAGVCCVEELCTLRPHDEVVLVSSSTVLKGVDSVIKITKTIEEVLVTEKDLGSLHYPNLRVLQAVVTSIDIQRKEVTLGPAGCLGYDTLCIAAGARPKVLGWQHERIITLRDTQSIEDFARQLVGARRIAVVGNGGIALELIGAVRDVEVVWVAKHGHIGDAFFDVDAAEFMLGVLQHCQPQQQQQQHQTEQQQQQQDHVDTVAQQQANASDRQAPCSSSSRDPHTAASAAAAAAASAAAAVAGHAAGPKWVNQLPKGKLPANVRLEKNALVVYAGSEPQNSCSSSSSIADGPWPLYVALSNGDTFGVDLLVQAIGVEPATQWAPVELHRAADGGIRVDTDFQSSVPGIYAVGDCCTVAPSLTAPHWFQMRLWSQARLMGRQAAAAMAGAHEDNDMLGFSFELFTHVTRFLGKKVVLLGLYNGQKLQHEPTEDVVMYTRALNEGTPDATFVRVLLLRGKMQGAVLIGETELEETFENLILDGLDLSQYGPGLLDPDIELDHVFD